MREKINDSPKFLGTFYNSSSEFQSKLNIKFVYIIVTTWKSNRQCNLKTSKTKSLKYHAQPIISGGKDGNLVVPCNNLGLFSNPHPTCQKILLVPYLKYIHNLITSHHIHQHYHGTNHHLHPGYCNTLPFYLYPLQSTPNKAASMMLLKSDSDYICPLLKSLPLLLVCFTVTDRISTVVFKVLGLSFPTALSFILKPHGAYLLSLKQARHFHLKDFVPVGPLPKMPFLPFVLLAHSLTSFKSVLKSHLLRKADLSSI